MAVAREAAKVRAQMQTMIKRILREDALGQFVFIAGAPKLAADNKKEKVAR